MNKSANLTLVILLFVILTISVSAQQTVYSLIIKYDAGDLSLEDLKILPGTSPRLHSSDTAYTVNILSFKNQILYTDKFSIDPEPYFEPPADWFDEQGNQIYFPEGDPIEYTKTAINLVLPYYPNAKKIDILSPKNKLLLSVDVSDYAKCNENSVCDNPNENYKNCNDCQSGVKDLICDKIADNKCDPDCVHGDDPDCPKKIIVQEQVTKIPITEKLKTPYYLIPMVIALILIAIIITIFLIGYSKRKRNQPSY